ncbi:MAG: FliM/FliN family flagellar motor switch protein, partial [Polyangiaceae bacterium]
VGAAVMLAREEVDSLALGDVALLGERFRDRQKRLGEDVVVVSHDCERGLRARLGEDGSLVILEGVEEIAMSAEKEAAADNAGQSPVIVRVEIGQVTMKAREWAALSPGDVIATGQKIADPIVLRVAGVEIARGELVELEGEVGVRIVSRS